MNKTINLGNTLIGEKQSTYIIAEMSANHAGNFERAKEIIHAAKEAGADCIKIQTYTADTMTLDSDKEYFKLKKGTWKGENLYSLYEKAYTPWEWQADLKEEAEKLGLDFFSTPYEKTAVDFLEGLGVGFYKIASFEIIDIPLIKYIASKGKPIIMSTGMATLSEIEEAVEAVKSQGNEDLCLLWCSSAYPAVLDDMNLKTIQHLKETFKVPVGLSDHSLGSASAVAAVTLGAKVIEKHLCLSRENASVDSSFSMEPAEFKKMVEDTRMAEQAVGEVSYGLSEREEISRRSRKSIFVVKGIKKGQKLTEDNIRIIRPGHGLKPKYYDLVLGREAKVDIEANEPLTWEKI
ncbi:pseudaminic acid synthase [Natroniella sp. ANB-PHB2]|uniref:pseudaminic acid synthase n=1 Tax=Natroniella sp. ANB-PHB2 TaxID=3384444 RepID=UPI0038D3E592